jgi:hypothetical protein
MIDKGCPDRHLVIAHDQAPFTQLVDMNQWDKRHAAFVSDPRVDVGLIHFEKQLGHLRERRWSPRVDLRAEPGRSS